MAATELPIAELRGRVVRALLRHRDELGLGSDEQVVQAWSALIHVPAIRYARWMAEAIRGAERLDS
jgi:hypothetical protein